MYPTLRLQKYLRISLMVLLIVIVSTGQVLNVSAGTNIWTSNGPNGNSIVAIVIDPVTPSTLYVGTDRSGVFRSTNSGESWEAVNSSLGSLYIKALAIDPHTPTTLYAGISDHGIFKSLNSGESWAEVNTGLPCTYINILVIDPVTPTTLYAGTICGVYKSINGGENWFEVNNGLPVDFVFTLRLDPLQRLRSMQAQRTRSRLIPASLLTC